MFIQQENGSTFSPEPMTTQPWETGPTDNTSCEFCLVEWAEKLTAIKALGEKVVWFDFALFYSWLEPLIGFPCVHGWSYIRVHIGNKRVHEFEKEK